MWDTVAHSCYRCGGLVVKDSSLKWEDCGLNSLKQITCYGVFWNFNIIFFLYCEEKMENICKINIKGGPEEEGGEGEEGM